MMATASTATASGDVIPMAQQQQQTNSDGAATTRTAVTAKKDTRNLHWKSNNVGSKLLAKMGWADGQAVGRRQRERGERIEGEGLRATQRPDGLGLGAAATTTAGALAAASSAVKHVQDFTSVLASLQQHHQQQGTGSKKTKRSSSSRSSKKRTATTLPKNRMTHAGVRQAKFQEKSEHDMKCIFGGAVDFAVAVTVAAEAVERGDAKEKKRSKKRKQADGGAADKETIDSSSESDRKKKRMKEKKEKKKKGETKL